MLEELLKCRTMKEIVEFGSALVESGGFNELQRDIAAKKQVFGLDEYLSPRILDSMTSSTTVFSKEMSKIKEEPETLQTLHYLQLFGACCPAFNGKITKLLWRCSC